MANKRALNAEDVRESCAKKRKISEGTIVSPLPQMDGLTDSADDKIFRFIPNTSKNLNISHPSYAPTGHPDFPPKMPLDGRNFTAVNNVNRFMSEFGLPQRLSRPSPKEDSLRHFSEIPLQFVNDVRERMHMPQQGFIHPTNGAFTRMVYPNHNSFSTDQKLKTKINDQSSANEFHRFGLGLLGPNTNGSCSRYDPFLDKRKDFGLNSVPLVNHPEIISNVRNFHPNFNKGANLFPGHFPYLRLPNIPEGPNAQESYANFTQFNHLPLVTSNHLFPPRAYVPFPNPVPHWNPGSLEKREFASKEMALDASTNNSLHSLPRSEYLDNKNSSDNASYSRNSSDPMKMIENFSASHFNSSFSGNLNASTSREDDWNKLEKKDRAHQEKCSGRGQQFVKPVNQLQSDKNKEMLTSDNTAKHFSNLPEKKTKRHKKNGEQLKYESWLYEKRNALKTRLTTLEHEMLSIPPSSSSCQELKNHFESAIAQLRKEGVEHEELIRVFESTKNIKVENKSDTSCSSVHQGKEEDKITKPAKSNGAIQHLNSHVASQPVAPQNIFMAHPSSSHQRSATNDTEPTNTCRPISEQNIHQNFPLPSIMEPSVAFTCNVNLRGWPPENEKPKMMDLKHDVHDGFKPSDALKVLESLPQEGSFKVLRMEDLGKQAAYHVIGNDETDIPGNWTNDNNEFRISSEWLFLNKKHLLAIESCHECCKNFERMPLVEEILVEMGKEKVKHNLKFCRENCMKAHQEKRKIWERDKKMHEELMEKDAGKAISNDLNSTIIYEVDANKTLPLDTSKENIQGALVESPSPIKKWMDAKYGTWCKLFHLKKKQKRSSTLDEKKDSNAMHSVRIPPGIRDSRSCFLCTRVGDEDGNGPGRLLTVDIDKWVHANCCLWSSNVYEALDGTFVGSKSLCGSTCACCNQSGATIMCFLPNCGLKFHLKCALSIGVCFLENKVTYCRHHCPKNMLSLLVKDISIKRRVCVERQENQQVAKMLKDDDPENFALRSGNLIVHSIGHLLPQFIHTFKFNTSNSIYPVGFRSVRFYWSYRRLHQRCQYVCSISEREGAPVFRISVEEEKADAIAFESDNCTGAWMQVLGRLDALRKSSGLSRVFTEYISGEDLFGLNEPAIRRVIESLPGVELLPNCKLKYGKSSMYIPPLAPNPSGCIRSEPKSRTLFKRSHTLLSNFNAGSSAKSTWLGSGEFSITQYMKQFTATKSQRYRSLKTEWRNNVYLRRSNIQGLGLFAGRELEQFTMVIEYIGEIIRNEIAEIREKIYEQQNRGVYMFRLDENMVIDATMTGGPARYINHCCDPNCFTEVIPTEKGNKIVIIAKRKILSGEELSYDYKFNLEDEKSKIPCLCGAANCFKWMN